MHRDGCLPGSIRETFKHASGRSSGGRRGRFAPAEAGLGLVAAENLMRTDQHQAPTCPSLRPGHLGTGFQSVCTMSQTSPRPKTGPGNPAPLSTLRYCTLYFERSRSRIAQPKWCTVQSCTPSCTVLGTNPTCGGNSCCNRKHQKTTHEAEPHKSKCALQGPLPQGVYQLSCAEATRIANPRKLKCPVLCSTTVLCRLCRSCAAHATNAC